MKITVSQLRRLIREVLSEEADVPGRWRASDGEPVSDEDLVKLGTGGFESPLPDKETEEKAG